MGKIVAVANQKGGVGKTTTSVNLAAALGVLEQKTLLIDADPQANATSSLGLEPSAIERGTYDCIEHTLEAEDCIQPTKSPNLDIMPAHLDLVAAEIELVDKGARETMLGRALEGIAARYDYLIIDCAPSLGLITLNALTAASSVIIPIQCEYFALEGLGKLLNTIKSVHRSHNPKLDIEGLLLTMYDPRLRLSNQVMAEVRKHFEKMVFETVITRNVRLGEAPSFGLPIIKYDAESKGAVNYLHLAHEFLQRNKDRVNQKLYV